MKKARRILALAVVVFLVLLYVLTFVFSLMDGELAQGLFRASFVCTILVPILLYAYRLIARVLGGRGNDPSLPTDTKNGKH